jgi:hypothetical protein
MQETQRKEQFLVLRRFGALGEVIDRKSRVMLTHYGAHAVLLLQNDLHTRLQDACGEVLVALAAQP